MLNQVSAQTGAGAEPRVAQIETEMMALRVNAEDLEAVVRSLEQRTIPVRRGLPSEAPQKEPGPVTPMPLLVPLAQQMNDICASIRNSVDHLRELQGAIELP